MKTPEIMELPKLEAKYYDAFVASMPAMRGKVVAITGTTSGTGLIAAKTLAAAGAPVFLLNRASDRAAAALNTVQSVKSEEGGATQIDCDLQDFATVRAAAAKIKKELDAKGLDVLANNAGVTKMW